jgi:hypothetical protein
MDTKEEDRHWEEMYRELFKRLKVLQYRTVMELSEIEDGWKCRYFFIGRQKVKKLRLKLKQIHKAIQEQPSVMIPEWMYDEMGYPGIRL